MFSCGLRPHELAEGGGGYVYDHFTILGDRIGEIAVAGGTIEIANDSCFQNNLRVVSPRRLPYFCRSPHRFKGNMHAIIFIAGVMLIVATLLDAVETILLPRRINHRFRYSRLYYRTNWRMWRRITLFLPVGRVREAMLGSFGPLSLLGLFVSWVVSLIIGFTCLQWSVSTLMGSNGVDSAPHSLATYFYYSGTTYFTLGLGDVIPAPGWSRALTVLEAGLGFGFLAIIISYLPVLYQAFSRREVTISLMDARAGSPPTGGEFVTRLVCDGRVDVGRAALVEWEHWCAELLESQISFPVLGYYRSQHANQSWLAALTAMLDACSLMLSVLPEAEAHQAKLTFAMARHAAVDITLVFGIRPPSFDDRRSRGGDLPRTQLLDRLGKTPEDLPAIQAKFAELRGLYEPFLLALSTHFLLTLPPVMATEKIDDNWQRSAWMSRTPGLNKLGSGRSGGDHFD